MNPDFGCDVDHDILQLWESDMSLNTFNNTLSNNSYDTTDVTMNLIPPQPEDRFEFQENFLPPVETSKTILSTSDHLPRRRLRKATLKKLSFSSTSDSSLASFDYSSEESFVPSTTPPPKRQKRAARSKTTPIKKSAAPPSPRGRGRPKKDDDDTDDDKLIHKRKYARAYREQHQQAVKDYQQCATDFYNILIANGVNVKQKFPQHSKIIQKLIEKMPGKKTTATKKSRRRY